MDTAFGPFERGGQRYSVVDVGGREAAAALAPRSPFGQIFEPRPAQTVLQPADCERPRRLPCR